MIHNRESVKLTIDDTDPDYTTCMSSGPSHDGFVINNKSRLRNSGWQKKYHMISNQVPIKNFSHTTSSYKNVGRANSGTLKRLAPSPSTLGTSYWPKLKRSRYELSKKSQYEKFTDNINRTKLFQWTTLSERDLREKKINRDNENNKNDEIPTNEKFLGSNLVGTSMIDTNMPPEKIDIYYFDHGTSGYYLTTDIAPILLSDKCVDKVDNTATRFWAEIFGTIHIGMAFITAFIIQLLRFILRSLIRPLVVGVIQMIADYAFKPFLTIIYNGIIQPILIFLYNIATSLRDLCEPIAQTMGFFLREFANLFRAIRLFDTKPENITNNKYHRLINEPT